MFVDRYDMPIKLPNELEAIEITEKGTYLLVDENDYKLLIELLGTAKVLKIQENSLALGEIIINYRRKKGLSQKELALMARMTGPQLANLENGKTKKPRISTLLNLKNALGEDFENMLMEFGYLEGNKKAI